MGASRIVPSRARRALLVALVLATPVALALAARPAGAQEPPRFGAERRPSPEQLERWRSLSEEERAVLRERFARLSDMPPDERARLEERAEAIEELKALVQARMPEELRQRLEALPAEERRAVLHAHLYEELRRRGGRILDKLPPAMRAELEGAPPGERERVLHELLRGMRGGPGGMHGFERLCGGLELPPEELERLRGLSPEERLREGLRLRKESLLERAERRGRPPHGMTPEEWEALVPLPPPAFFEELSRRGRGPRGEPGPGPEDAGVRELEEALRPTLDDLIESAERSGLDRLRFLGERSRERALDVLERRGLVPPEELGRLSGLEGLEFFRALRERFGLRHGPPRPFGGPEGFGEDGRGFPRGRGEWGPPGGRGAEPGEAPGDSEPRPRPGPRGGGRR